MYIYISIMLNKIATADNLPHTSFIYLLIFLIYFIFVTAHIYMTDLYIIFSINEKCVYILSVQYDLLYVHIIK